MMLKGQILTTGFLLAFLCQPGYANVGVVDTHDKLAACSNAPSSTSKGPERYVNPSNVLANLGDIVERKRRPSPRQERRGSGSTGGSGQTR